MLNFSQAQPTQMPKWKDSAWEQRYRTTALIKFRIPSQSSAFPSSLALSKAQQLLMCVFSPLNWERQLLTTKRRHQATSCHTSLQEKGISGYMLSRIALTVERKLTSAVRWEKAQGLTWHWWAPQYRKAGHLLEGPQISPPLSPATAKKDTVNVQCLQTSVQSLTGNRVSIHDWKRDSFLLVAWRAEIILFCL